MTTLQDLLTHLGQDVKWHIENGAPEVSRPIMLNDETTDVNTLSFCKWTGEKGINAVKNSIAETIIISTEQTQNAFTDTSKNIIAVENPRLSFVRILNAFFTPKSHEGIHPSAVIHPSAKVGNNFVAAPHVSVGNATLGNNVTLYEGVRILDGSVIGNNVTIGPNTVVGWDGFGFERNESGTLEKFPHLGKVIIEDDVELGAANTVDKGTLGDTVVGQGTKTDNMVHIAHNVRIGKHCVITAQTLFSGSITTGNNCWFAPNCVMMNGITIGEGAIIGLGAVVTKSVDPNTTVAGVPAKPLPRK